MSQTINDVSKHTTDGGRFVAILVSEGLKNCLLEVKKCLLISFFYVLIGVLLKGMVESSLMFKHEHLAPILTKLCRFEC